ncbi:hypothetical protein WN51_02582 [Melipona quadrifasciata]|uniref:Uncharacterized protein n=1 Tax=Melipona quadrifasciata TaxID=166423 RepID=A0A0M8ZUY4_9HYME|nr:hypothetical protein WN51_02582 [Melipona quadrifasciata]
MGYSLESLPTDTNPSVRIYNTLSAWSRPVGKLLMKFICFLHLVEAVTFLLDYESFRENLIIVLLVLLYAA